MPSTNGSGSGGRTAPGKKRPAPDVIVVSSNGVATIESADRATPTRRGSLPPPIRKSAAGASETPVHKAGTAATLKQAPRQKKARTTSAAAAGSGASAGFTSGNVAGKAVPVERPTEDDGIPAVYDDGIHWLWAGLRRQRGAVLLGLLFGWTFAWLALWGAVLGAAVGGLVALGAVTSRSVGGYLFHIGVGQAVTVISVGTGVVWGAAGMFFVDDDDDDDE